LREGETIGLLGDGPESDLACFVAESSRVGTVLLTDGETSGLAKILHISKTEGSLGRAIQALAHIGRVVTTDAGGADLMKIPDYYREMIIKETTIAGSGRPAREDLTAAVALVYDNVAHSSLLSAAERLPMVSMD
jgi:hypothetical protein